MINKTHNNKVKTKMRSQIHLVAGCGKEKQAEALAQDSDTFFSLCLHFNSSSIYWVIPW